jgi:hypothetical protein
VSSSDESASIGAPSRAHMSLGDLSLRTQLYPFDDLKKSARGANSTQNQPPPPTTTTATSTVSSLIQSPASISSSLSPPAHNPALPGFASTGADLPPPQSKAAGGGFSSTSLLSSVERSLDEAASFSAAVAVSNTALLYAIDDVDPVVLAALSQVLNAERLEVRVASELPLVLDAGSPRAIFERLFPLHVAVDTPLLALWMHTYRAFSTPRELHANLVDRFAKPLRRFASLPALDVRLSTAQRNAVVARTRSQVLYILDYWLRHYVTDFIDDDRLFAECCAFLAHHRVRSARDRHSGSFLPDALAAAASAAVAAADGVATDALGRRRRRRRRQPRRRCRHGSLVVAPQRRRRRRRRRRWWWWRRQEASATGAGAGDARYERRRAALGRAARQNAAAGDAAGGGGRVSAACARAARHPHGRAAVEPDAVRRQRPRVRGGGRDGERRLVRALRERCRHCHVDHEADQ